MSTHPSKSNSNTTQTNASAADRLLVEGKIRECECNDEDVGRSSKMAKLTTVLNVSSVELNAKTTPGEAHGQPSGWSKQHDNTEESDYDDEYYDINAKNAAAKPFNLRTRDQVDCPATMERLWGDTHKTKAPAPQKSNDYVEQQKKKGILAFIKQEKEGIVEKEEDLRSAPDPIANTTSAQTIANHVIYKRNEIKEAMTKVEGEIARYSATYASNKDSWKRDRGVYFYNLLYDWLTCQAGSDMAVGNYDANELSKVITEFESTMAGLITSESEDISEHNYNNVEFYKKLIKTWVEEVEEMIQHREN